VSNLRVADELRVGEGIYVPPRIGIWCPNIFLPPKNEGRRFDTTHSAKRPVFRRTRAINERAAISRGQAERTVPVESLLGQQGVVDVYLKQASTKKGGRLGPGNQSPEKRKSGKPERQRVAALAWIACRIHEHQPAHALRVCGSKRPGDVAA
jgi:hypothetical protein